MSIGRGQEPEYELGHREETGVTLRGRASGEYLQDRFHSGAAVFFVLCIRGGAGRLAEILLGEARYPGTLGLLEARCRWFVCAHIFPAPVEALDDEYTLIAECRYFRACSG